MALLQRRRGRKAEESTIPHLISSDMPQNDYLSTQHQDTHTPPLPMQESTLFDYASKPPRQEPALLERPQSNLGFKAEEISPRKALNTKLRGFGIIAGILAFFDIGLCVLCTLIETSSYITENSWLCFAAMALINVYIMLIMLLFPSNFTQFVQRLIIISCLASALLQLTLTVLCFEASLAVSLFASCNALYHLWLALFVKRLS